MFIERERDLMQFSYNNNHIHIIMIHNIAIICMSIEATLVVWMQSETKITNLKGIFSKLCSYEHLASSLFALFKPMQYSGPSQFCSWNYVVFMHTSSPIRAVCTDHVIAVATVNHPKYLKVCHALTQKTVHKHRVRSQQSEILYENCIRNVVACLHEHRASSTLFISCFLALV